MNIKKSQQGLKSKILVPKKSSFQGKSGEKKQRILSPRTHKFIEHGKRPIKGVKKQKILIFVPEEELFLMLSSVEQLFPKSIMFCQKLTAIQNTSQISKNQTVTNYWILTSIDAFTQTYRNLFENVKQGCKKWLIISNAINSKVAQQNLNEIYSPLHFQFIQSFPQACNTFLGYKQGETVLQIDSLVDINSIPECNLPIYQNYLSIQHRYSGNVKFNCREVYLIKNLSHCKLIENKNVYFVTKSARFVPESSIYLSNQIISPVVLVLLKDFVKIESLENFKIFQDVFRKQKLNPKIIIFNINNKTQKYLVKLTKQLILDKNICVFYENVLKSPIKSVSSQKQMESESMIKKILQYEKRKQIFFLPQEFRRPSFYSYLLKFNKKTSDCSVFSFSATRDYAKQIQKIEKFIHLKEQLLLKFKQKRILLRKMIIHFYLNDQFTKSHLVTLLLKQIQVNCQEIKHIDTMYETHKITIVYGHLSYKQIMSLSDFHNVFVVPLQKKQEDNATFLQIEEAQTFLNVVQRSYSQFYDTKQDQLVSVHFDIIYEQPQSVTCIKTALKFTEAFLNVYKVGQYSIALKQFKDYSKHIIIIQMSQFTETIETYIKDIQWNISKGIQIQVYIKYGQSFIQRTKTQNFKFLKTIELQKKIDQATENYINVPVPQIVVPQPHYIPGLLLVNSDEEHRESDKRIKQIQEQQKQEETYKLYLCIHRSIPFHSLRQRCGKQYKILIYNRIEEVLIFSRYINPTENITIIANKNSQQIYAEIMRKLKITQEKLQFIYCKDISESYIRKQIDKLLQQMNIKDVNQSIISKHEQRFIPVVLYNRLNQRSSKAVKILKKLFNHQLKIQFLKFSEFEELSNHSLKFRIHQQVKIFKLGSHRDFNYEKIRSIKGLIMVAMHPDAKAFTHDLKALKFSLKLFLVKKLYGDLPKNYEIKSKSKSSVERNLIRIKSLKMVPPRQTRQSKFRDLKLTQQLLFREKSETPRKKSIKTFSQHQKHSSIMKNNSTLKYHYDNKVSVIISAQINYQHHNKNKFANQRQLIVQILKNQNESKLSIVVISENQFQLFEILLCRNPSGRFPDIIWLVCTSKSAKQIFITETILFVQNELISELIENIRKQYKSWINFDRFQVLGPQIPELADFVGDYRIETQGKMHSFTIKIFNEKLNPQENHLNQKEIIYFGYGKGELTSSEGNTVIFPSFQCLVNVLHCLIGSLTEQNKPTQRQNNFGSFILCPSPTNKGKEESALKIIRQSLNKFGFNNFCCAKEYDITKPHQLIVCSMFRMLIFYSEVKNTEYNTKLNAMQDSLYSQLLNSVTYNGNKQKVNQILQHMLFV